MTSIEWFANEVYRAIDLQSEGKISATIAGIKISEAKYKAKEMRKQEMEISDEEIKKAANNPNNDKYCFQEGAKWYREQLKQPKKD